MDKIIDNKINLIKKETKELQELLNNTLQEEQQSNNKKLIFIKRNVDKFKTAAKYLIGLRFEKKEKSDALEEDIMASYEIICKKAIELNQKLDLLYNKESIRSASSYVGNIKFNLDSIRLGLNYLKRIDFYGLFEKEIQKKKDNT